MKIIQNPNKDFVEQMLKALKENDLKTIESLSRYIISEFKDLLKQGYRSYVNRYENDYEFKMVGGKIYFCKFISKRKIKLFKIMLSTKY